MLLGIDQIIVNYEGLRNEKGKVLVPFTKTDKSDVLIKEKVNLLYLSQTKRSGEKIKQNFVHHTLVGEKYLKVVLPK